MGGDAGERVATLNGRFILETRTSTLPATATLRLHDGDDTVVVPCTVTGSDWTCATPAGKFDAELHAPGFVPVNLWGIELSASTPRDAGEVTLRQGGILRGTVLERGRGISGVEVELAPSAALTGGDAARAAILTRRASTDRSGAFAFTDLGTGTYSLATRYDGYSTASSRSLRVEAPHVLELAPMQILPLAKLDVHVTPPLDFHGAPWVCTLERATPLSRYHEVVRRGMTSQAGHWSATLLDAGSTYRLRIATSKGEAVESRDIELMADMILPLDIAKLVLDGTITMGDKPVSAWIALLAEDGPQFTFRSNEEGVFSGVLPKRSAWRARVRIVQPRIELQVDEVDLRTDGDKVHARIELPGGEAKGKVVDENGQPLSATVMITGDRGLEATTASSAKGEFHFVGLTDGARSVKAMTDDGESDPMRVSVDGEDTAPLTLVVRTAPRIRGEVVDAAGSPIAGATIRYQQGREARTATSGVTGEFSFAVAPGAVNAPLAVLADGWPRVLLSWPVASRERLRVVLGPAKARLGIDFGSAPPWPYLRSSGSEFFALPHLFLPRAGGPPVELREDRFWFDLQPGTYTVCSEPALSDRCVTRVLAPHGTANVKLTAEGWR
jgi:hypothetical protein